MADRVPGADREVPEAAVEAAVEAAADALFKAAVMPWYDYKDQARAALVAALPVLERQLRDKIAADVWDAARTAVARQTDLTELVHFERPSDFRKGVLTCLVALDNERESVVRGGS